MTATLFEWSHIVWWNGKKSVSITYTSLLEMTLCNLMLSSIKQFFGPLGMNISFSDGMLGAWSPYIPFIWFGIPKREKTTSNYKCNIPTALNQFDYDDTVNCTKVYNNSTQLKSINNDEMFEWVVRLFEQWNAEFSNMVMRTCVPCCRARGKKALAYMGTEAQIRMRFSSCIKT